MIITRIYEWAHRNPNRTAIVWNGAAVTYGSFARSIEAARNTLATANLRIGSTAVVILNSLLDGWIAITALRALGLNTVAVNSIGDAQALGLQDVSCIVFDRESLQRSPLKNSPWPDAKGVLIPADFCASIPEGPLPELPPETCPQGGHILYTSGTTGSNKKLFLSGESEDFANAKRAGWEGMTPDTVWYIAYLGTWTAIGFKFPLAVWHAGGCVVFDQRKNWAEHFFRQRVTHAMLIPHMVDTLLKSRKNLTPVPARGQWNLTVAGGFLPATTARGALEGLTANLEINYGSTEIFGRIMDTKISTIEDMHWLLPCNGRILEIVDEDGRPCPTGTDGCLRVRLTPQDCDAYLGDPHTTSKFFRDGCFYPGDMAVQREDGRVRILGRSADVLNFRGRKIATAPLEQNLQERLGARSVCLFSGIDENDENEIMIAMESDRPFAQDEMDSLEAELRDYGRVRFASLKEFPTTTTGNRKVNRIALRKLLFPSRD